MLKEICVRIEFKEVIYMGTLSANGYTSEEISRRYKSVLSKYSPYSGEHCTLCGVLGRHRFVDRKISTLLCSEHCQLYKEDIKKMKSGSKKFPPDLTEKAKQSFMSDEQYWTEIRLLELLVDKGEMHESDAQEQMRLLVASLCISAEHEGEAKRMMQETSKKMLADTHLY